MQYRQEGDGVGHTAAVEGQKEGKWEGRRSKRGDSPIIIRLSIKYRVRRIVGER